MPFYNRLLEVDKTVARTIYDSHGNIRAENVTLHTYNIVFCKHLKLSDEILFKAFQSGLDFDSFQDQYPEEFI